MADSARARSPDDRVEHLLANPSESLAVELKAWIDPATPHGRAKIVCCCLAMRNNDGGTLIVGFDDKTHQPTAKGKVENVRRAFHSDVVQAMISAHASDRFEVAVQVVTVGAFEHVVIEIPSGVRTPVVSKSVIAGVDPRHPLLKDNRIFVRTLDANGIPSSSEAHASDWTPLMERCFDNREADIGRFMRRQLTSLTSTNVSALADALRMALFDRDEVRVSRARTIDSAMTDAAVGRIGPIASVIPVEPGVLFVLDDGKKRLAEALGGRTVDLANRGWWEVAVTIHPPLREARATNKALGAMLTANPGLTGWPPWLDSRRFADSTTHPYVREKSETWQALVLDTGKDWGNHVDFWQVAPAGFLYLCRALQDDMNPSMVLPNTQLDWVLNVIRPAEAIIVARAYARALGCDPSLATLTFAFRWTGLRNRVLSAWAQPQHAVSPGRISNRDEIASYGSLPLETSPRAIAPFVKAITIDLFDAFDGFEVDLPLIEDLVSRLVERRLPM